VAYVHPVFSYVAPPELSGKKARRQVVIAGAGPIGLCAAIDLAQHDVPTVVVDDDNTVSVGSRAICYAKRTLEILDRLGCGADVVDKGVQWHVGRVFFHDREAYRFDLLPEPGHCRPAFVNLQQYHFEEILVERALRAGVELRWRHQVVGVAPHDDEVSVDIETRDGRYSLDTDWLIAADGSRSTVRKLLGLDTEGHVFHDRFLIADIRMTSAFPTERWFWFDPPFHPGQSVLLHRQADDIWRVDFQLGADADPDEEKKPERILPRLTAMLGKDARFEIVWASVYTFRCQRMQHFRHGRVLFAGDSAHLVSPFGARGANSGIQDVDNLVWKLTLVARDIAPERLLDTYDDERTRAADENILHSTRATDFISPKSAVSRVFRDAVLELARRYPFARRLVNSGRLSTASVLDRSLLNTPDAPGAFADAPTAPVPGTVVVDAPVVGPRGQWLHDYLGGTFVLLAFDPAIAGDQVAALSRDTIPCAVVSVGGDAIEGAMRIEDRDGLASERYDGKPGTVYLFRPDQHVCARWRAFDLEHVRAAIARATCTA
jgi:3-(3-hydroxy-phenyl)propionate hydroxylase